MRELLLCSVTRDLFSIFAMHEYDTINIKLTFFDESKYTIHIQLSL